MACSVVGLEAVEENHLIAMVLMAAVLGSTSSFEVMSTPDFKHNSVIKLGKNKHPFGLKEHADISR